MVAFQSRAKSCVTDWKEQLYHKSSNDPHYLAFSAFKPSLHEPVREQLKKGVVEDEAEGGPGNGKDRRSYVATGSLTIFSEDIIKENQNGPKSMPK